jgi:hypothetical protein
MKWVRKVNVENAPFDTYIAEVPGGCLVSVLGIAGGSASMQFVPGVRLQNDELVSMQQPFGNFTYEGENPF